MACMFYFSRCIKIIFNSLLGQLVKYDVHTTRKIKFIHAICYHILLLYHPITVWYKRKSLRNADVIRYSLLYTTVIIMCTHGFRREDPRIRADTGRRTPRSDWDRYCYRSTDLRHIRQYLSQSSYLFKNLLTDRNYTGYNDYTQKMI